MHYVKNLSIMALFALYVSNLICSNNQPELNEFDLSDKTQSQQRLYQHLAGTQLVGDSMYGPRLTTQRQKPKIYFPELSDKQFLSQQTPVSSTAPAFPTAVAAVFDEHGKIKRGNSLLGVEVASASCSAHSSSVDLFAKSDESRVSRKRTDQSGDLKLLSPRRHVSVSRETMVLEEGSVKEVVSEGSSSRDVSGSGSPTSMKAPGMLTDGKQGEHFRAVLQADSQDSLIIPAFGSPVSSVVPELPVPHVTNGESSDVQHPNYIASQTDSGHDLQIVRADGSSHASQEESVFSAENQELQSSTHTHPRLWSRQAARSESGVSEETSCWQKLLVCLGCAYIEQK